MKKLQFFIILTLFTYLGLSRSLPAATHGVNDLALHFAGYVILVISGMVAFSKYHITVPVMLLVYSTLIEILQYFLPYRTFSLLDIIANLSGLLVGSILWIVILKIITKGPPLPDNIQVDHDQR